MAEETHLAEAPREPRKRKIGKSSKSKKKAKMQHQSPDGMRGTKPKKVGSKMKKLYRRRAQNYNSDDEKPQDDDSRPPGNNEEDPDGGFSPRDEVGKRGGDQNGSNGDDVLSDDDQAGEILPGIMKFSEGSKAFKVAFQSIINKSVPEDVLGPVLSGKKKLIAEKLAEEESERNAKGVAKKEKQLVIEKGHVIPEYLSTHEKFLIGVATKGVVKLFNAVSKAQNAQKGLNPSKFKDAKVIRKRRKEAFFSELGKTPSQTAKAHTSKGQEDGDGPAWAPLRDNYMLTNPKLKDWDKDTAVEDDIGRMSEDSSDDD